MTKNTLLVALAIAQSAVGGGAMAQDADGIDGERGKRPGHHRAIGAAGPIGGPFGRGFGDPAMMIERMAEHLELDDVQQQSIANIVASAKPEFEALREASGAHREAIHALDVTDPEYGIKLQDLSAVSGELATRLTLLTGRVRGEIAAVLTDDQRAALEARLSTFGERRRHPRPDRSD